MVEDVIEVHSHLEFCGLAESEKLANTQVHAPRARPNEGVSLGHVGVIEDVRARSWERKRSRIEELISTHTGVWVANQTRTKTWTTKIAHRVDKAAGNVAGEYRIAVITVPVWGKPGATLRKHVPGHLEATRDSVRPLGKRVAKLASLSKRNVVRAIRDEAMTGNKRVARKIRIRVELIIERATETRIPDVQTARFLIEQRVREIERQPASKPAIDFELKRMRMTPTNIPIACKEGTESIRKRTSGFILCRLNAVAEVIRDRTGRRVVTGISLAVGDSSFRSNPAIRP